MTETRRANARYATLGFIRDDLEGEECVECGEQATAEYHDEHGAVHYCDKCDPGHA